MTELGHICSNCEFWEKHFDRANDGRCFLDCYGSDIMKETKAKDSCEFWMGLTVDED
jgi:hypothetical protein